MAEEKEKGFKVIDKRRIGKEEAPEEKQDIPKVEKKGEEEKKEEVKDTRRVAFERTQQEKDAKTVYNQAGKTILSKEPGFPELVNILAGYAMTSLGMFEGPGVQPGAPDLEMARHFIDLLGVLEDKSRGNLTAEEDRFLREALYQLRMIYVQLSQQKGETSS